MSKINKTPIETRLAIERRSAAMLPDRPTLAGFKPWDIKRALFEAIISDKGACLMGELDRIVDEINLELKKRETVAGQITLQSAQWSGDEAIEQAVMLGGDILTEGSVILFSPANDETREAAGRARLHMSVDKTNDNDVNDYVVFAKAQGGEAPGVNLSFSFFIVRTGSRIHPTAAMVGVDAYGSDSDAPEGVDENAVKKIINSLLGNVANERQYSAANPPPYPVTSVNGQTGAVKLSIPSKASDVGADPAGTAWNKTAALRQEVDTKLEDYDKSAIVDSKIELHNLSTGSHSDIRIAMLRLGDRLNAALNSDDTSLDDLKEIVAYIKSNKTLIDNVTASKVNVTDIVDNLVTNVSNKPLSAAQGVVLKLLIDSLEEIVDGKTTTEQVVDQIKAELTIHKEDADNTYQPIGDYLTLATGDQRYAKSSDIPTKTSQLENDSGFLTQHQSLAHLLPKDQGTSNAGKIMAVGDDGQVVYIDAPAGSDIIGNFTEDGGIELYKDLPMGTYTLYTVDSDGNRVKYATMTVTESSSSSYTNILTSGDATVNPNQRWSGSSNGLTDCDGMICVQIPVELVSGKTLYFKGFTKALKSNNQGAVWMAVNSDNTLNGRLLQSTDGNVWTCAALVYDDATTVGSLMIDSSTFAGIASAEKLCLNIAVYESAEITTLPDTLVMTIDEPIE